MPCELLSNTSHNSFSIIILVYSDLYLYIMPLNICFNMFMFEMTISHRHLVHTIAFKKAFLTCLNSVSSFFICYITALKLDICPHIKYLVMSVDMLEILCGLRHAGQAGAGPATPSWQEALLYVAWRNRLDGTCMNASTCTFCLFRLQLYVLARLLGKQSNGNLELIKCEFLSEGFGSGVRSSSQTDN